mgnify:CR=1 FL=1
MKCNNCGTEAQKGDRFCLKCGAALTGKRSHASHAAPVSHSSHEDGLSATLPAEQAEKLLKEARKMVKHLSNEELVMGVSSAVAFLSFFLPWYGSQNGFSLMAFNGWYFFIPIVAVASIVLLYFSQGAKQSTKVFLVTIQAVIGMYIFATGIHAANNGSNIGLWLTILAGGTLTGASLYFQKKGLLK